MHVRRAALLVALVVMGSLLPYSEAGAANGRYIVRLREAADPEATAKAHGNRYGVQADRFYHSVIRGYAATVPENRLDDLRDDPAVLTVMKRRMYRAAAITRPQAQAAAECDPSTTECLPTGVDRIDADQVSGTGNGVQVAVIDSGMDLDHPDLAANIVGGEDCSGGDTNDWNDDNGHGTHVAGTIAAIDNTTGVRGVAPAAKLWAVKILNSQGAGSDDDILCGLEFVYIKAIGNPGGTIKIANMSIEAPFTNIDDGDCGFTIGDIVHQAVCAIVEKGVTFIAAAGNHTDDIKDIAPAAYDEVIAATALADWDGAPCLLGDAPPFNDDDDTFGSFSSYATTAADRAHTIGAPGVEILSTWIDGYAYNVGTSMAAPHIAGVVALYLQANPNATPAQVMAVLKETGEPLNVNAGSKCAGTSPSHIDPSGLHPEPVVCAVGCDLPLEVATPGIVRGNVWFLNNAFDSSGSVAPFAYGGSGDRPIVGDWNANGIDSPGVISGTRWYLDNNFAAPHDIASFSYGLAGDKFVAGDWNDDDVDGPGTVHGNRWYLGNDFNSTPDIPSFTFGLSTDRPIVGDWNGDGIDTPGVMSGARFYLGNDFNSTHDIPSFGFGRSTDVPIAGDWDGDGKDEIGVRRGSDWFLQLRTGAVIHFAYGRSTDKPVVGDWNGPL